MTDELVRLVAAGQIAHDGDVDHGFENLPSTLRRVHTGANLGTQLLEI